MTNSFKFNKDHCLNVFNILKSGGAPNNSNGGGGAGGNQFERGYNNGGAYVNLNGQSRAEYLRHVELIDLQLDFFQKRGGGNPTTKKRGSNHSKSGGSGTNTSNEDSSSSDQVSMTPPQSLREIFQISNNNRKRNKLRKKTKLDQCQLGEGGNGLNND